MSSAHFPGCTCLDGEICQWDVRKPPHVIRVGPVKTPTRLLPELRLAGLTHLRSEFRADNKTELIFRCKGCGSAWHLTRDCTDVHCPVGMKPTLVLKVDKSTQTD